MHRHLKKRLLFFIGIVWWSWVCCPAGAYVLPGPHVLELMTRNLKHSKRLLISQKLILHEETQDGAVEFNETLKYVFPDVFRSDIMSASIQRIHLVSKGMALTVIDGKAVAESETLYDRYKDIILYNSRALLEKRLSFHGIDITVTSLGRFQGQPMYVLGAQYPDEAVPQIWLHKDTFRPFRWIITGKTSELSKDPLEVRYLDWRQLNQMWYPMRIEFYRYDLLVREITVQHMEAVPAFSEDLFDIDHMKSIYLPEAAKDSNQGEEKDLNEVQKTIEEFKKMYE